MIGRITANLTPAFPALAGDRGYVAFTLYQDALQSAVIDLTGYTAKFTVRGSDGTTHAAATQANGIALGGTAGTITSTLTAVQTAALTHAAAHGGRYSLVLTSSGGAVVPLASGPVAILEVPGL